MMTDVKKPVYTDLTRPLKRIVSAHDAVLLGIATHAEKERNTRETAARKLEAERKLHASIVPGKTQ